MKLTMCILIVEDEMESISGIRQIIKTREWDYEIVNYFCETAAILSDETKYLNILLLDLILPWGIDAPESLLRLDNRMAGLYILQGMRERGEGHSIFNQLSIKPLNGRHIKTPIIIFTKLPDKENDCRELGIINFFYKTDYNYEDIIESIEPFIEK